MRWTFLALVLLGAAPAFADAPAAAPLTATSESGGAESTVPVVDVGPTFTPRWGVILRGGSAISIGSQASYNVPGGLLGFDGVYQFSGRADLDLGFLYDSMPYSSAGGGAPNPLSTEGLALKVDYVVYQANSSRAWLGVGAGYMGFQATNHVLRVPVTSPPVFDTSPDNSAGLALLACAGLGYDFDANWSLNLEMDVESIDASGGTSNNLLAALPNLSVKWMH